MVTVQEQARRLVDAGLSVIPICGDGSKAPAVQTWKQYQGKIVDSRSIGNWFRSRQASTLGLALICGAVSGNVECVDFDDGAAFAEWWSLVSMDDPFAEECIAANELVITETPGPGMQVWYRCEAPVAGNQKLARRPPNAEEIAEDEAAGRKARQWVVLIETRGEGGYAIIPPSPGCCHPSGRPYRMFQGDLAELPLLTSEQRRGLLEAALALNRYDEPQQAVRAPKSPPGASGDHLRPGDDYNRRGSWDELLVRHGWRHARSVGDAEHWVRPGKGEGRCSATVGAVAPGILYVFSTNAAPFESERSYDLFGGYALLQHGGDFAAAGRALRERGFGSPPKRAGNGSNGARKPGDPDTNRDEMSGSGAEVWGDEEPPLPEEDEAPEGVRAPDEHKLAMEWAESVRRQFLYAEGDEWWSYNERCWLPVSDSTVYTHLRNWLQAGRKGKRVAVKQKRVRELAFLASTILGDGQGPLPRARLNADRALLPLENGMLNVQTRCLAPHGPEHYNTYCLPYGYDPAARCGRFRQFLQEVMIHEDGSVCDEWGDTLVQWMGYCLIPDCRAETVLVNVGEGGNGKSLWAKVLESLVGDVNCASIDPRQLELKPDYELASLYGKMVGFLNEPTRQMLAGCAGRIKALVSGDLVQARHPYKQPFSYRPHCRMVVSCNDMPDARDLSHGWYRRQLIIEWRYRPASPDRKLDRKLLAELPGILNLALDGLDALREREYEFAEPEESKRLKADYRHGQDTVAQFLEAECEADPERPELWSPSASIYDRYAAWCKRAGYQALNMDAFGKHISKRLGYPESTIRKIGGKPVRGRPGVMLREAVGYHEEEQSAYLLQ